MNSDPAFVRDIDARASKGDQACAAAAICLQAMRSVICSSGCAGSAATAAYFSGTVTTLQRHLQQPSGADVDATTAALMLILRRALPVVSPAAAATRLQHIVEAMTAVLKDSSKEELVRQALGVLASIADMTFDGLTESSRPNRKVLKPVFSFIGDPRQAVRHRAQLAATSVLKRASEAQDQQTLDFASTHLAKMIAGARVDKKTLDEIPARHAVTLLKAVAPLLPPDNLSAVVEALVELPTKLGQHPVSVEAFEFLASHLASQSGEGVPEHHIALAATVLQGMMMVPVSLLNVAYAVGHTRALCEAIAVLSGQSAGTAGRQALPQKKAALKQLFALFSERDPGLLKGIREGCLTVLRAAGESGDLPLLEAIPELCRPLLGYQFKGAWPHALPVIGGLFTALGAIRAKVAPVEIQAWTQARFACSRELVAEIVGARDKARSAELTVFGKELSQCLGSAVATFGPELVLSVAELKLLEHPLSDPNFEQLSRSWLLLVLRDSCKRTSLAFFASKFLPLAMALKSRAVEAEANSPTNAKKYSTLLEHVWAILPGFCDEPVDMQVALLAEGGKLAKYLVQVLQGEAQFREYVWAGLARLASVTHEPPSRLSEALNESNRGCLKTLSARVMPEMFTAYVKIHGESEGQDASRVSHARQLALDTVQSFSRLAEPDLLTNLFKSIVQKILKATVGGADAAEKAKATPIADLANALVPQLPGDQLDLVLKVFTPMLSGAAADGSEEDKATATSLQKSGYRAVRNVVQHPAASKGGDATKMLEFWAVLRDSRQTCEPPALKARLVAIQALLDLLQQRLAPFFNQLPVRQGYLQCLQSALPEIMSHLRDQSMSVREAARECLHTAATTAIHQELAAEVVTLLSAGLASLTPHSKAAAIDALSRLLYEHFTLLDATLRDRLIKVTLLLLEDRDAQVYRATLKFAKVVVFVVSKEDLAEYTRQILKLFENRHLASAKMLVRKIVERLVRLLGSEDLTEVFPEAHLPLLNYVQRQLARRQRPESMKKGAGEDDDDEEKEGDAEMEDVAAKPKKSYEAFRDEDKEDGDDDDDMEGKGKKKRVKREAKGPAEPGTSSVMAHEAMQSLLDAWEAESDGEGAGGRSADRKGKRKRGEVSSSTWIHEDANVPLDFMSADAAHSVLTTRPSQAKRQRGEVEGPAGAENRADQLRRHGLRFADDGRLVVDESVEAEKGDSEDDDGAERKFSHGVAGKSEPKALSRLAQMRANRASAKAKARVERRNSHIVKGLEEYKPGSSKAAGDAKRHSKLNPFAYVRLNPKVTKEKFRGKATDSFSKVIKGAKQGVLKGHKAKERDAKQKQFKHAQKRRRGQNQFVKRPTNLR